MTAPMFWRIVTVAGWGFAFGGAIGQIVALATGHSLDHANQIAWVSLTLTWIVLGLVNSKTIASQRKTIALLQARQQQRDRAWLS